MRVLLRENRMISSIAADLDQKSCWEVLTDPRLCQQYFTADERQVFQRHILWTRVLGDRRTVLPDGRLGRPARLRARRHESLVLKPNRAYGGDGIVIGPAVTRENGTARSDPHSQTPTTAGSCSRSQRFPVREFPVVGPDGDVHVEPFYTVMGFAASEYGVAILAPRLAKAGGERGAARRAFAACW